MTFDEWIFKVCEHISLKTRREMTDIYCSINLTDAKLSFIDGVLPENYRL